MDSGDERQVRKDLRPGLRDVVGHGIQVYKSVGIVEWLTVVVDQYFGSGDGHGRVAKIFNLVVDVVDENILEAFQHFVFDCHQIQDDGFSVFVNLGVAIYNRVAMEKCFDRTGFAKRLKEARLRRKFSIRELGEKVLVTGSAIAYYESGKRLPRLQILERLATVLELTIDYLVWGVPNE